MYLVVGLGNPEEDYANTRHNMGFDVLNELSEKYGIEINHKKFKGIYGTGNVYNEKIMLLKPQTFMNLSGESIREVIDYYKLDLDKVIVVYDDIDLEPGLIRIRKSGGPGTHNGMKSVVSCLNSQKFARVRVGIGKPMHGDLIQYVIGTVSKEDKEQLSVGIKKAAEAIDDILKNNIDIAMNHFN